MLSTLAARGTGFGLFAGRSVGSVVVVGAGLAHWASSGQPGAVITGAAAPLAGLVVVVIAALVALMVPMTLVVVVVARR